MRHVHHIDVELGVGLRVNVVHREGVAGEKTHAVDCSRCVCVCVCVCMCVCGERKEERG